MANPAQKFPDNFPGAYYVDEECIDCRLCSEIAPDIFFANEEEGHHFVGKQPESAEELEQAFEALESCPVEAIGRDGEL